MDKTQFTVVFILFSLNIFSQNNLDNKDNSNVNSVELENEKLIEKTKYTDYKIISHKRDTSYIDTTLTIQKEYKFNYLRTDNFELLEFHNQGQTLTNLGYGFSNMSFLPDIGFTAKQFSYLEIEDIKYYEVPTPTTQMSYRTGLQQGQFLDAILTLNFSKRFNTSLSYKGLRSLGAYRRSLVSNGNFRATFNYKTKENQYEIRGHITSQDFYNQESGGLPETEIEKFSNDDPNYKERSRLDVNLADAESYFEATRLYLEHSYKLFSKKDIANIKDFSNLKLGHIFTTETKKYWFNQQSSTTNIFGEESPTDVANNKAKSVITNNEISLDFNSKYILGQVKAKINLINFEYGYDEILNSNSQISNKKIIGNAAFIGAGWNAKVKNFELNASGNLSLTSGLLSGSNLKSEAIYKKDSLFEIKGSLLINSKSANFNALLHQSKYDRYNWENNFNRVNTRDLGFYFNSKFINTSLNFTNIDNHIYFDENSKPQQFESQITYLKIKANREFRYKKFAVNNTVMFQNVSSGSSVFRVPKMVTRNTLYYTDYWFKGKPMLVNIGVTFNYFSKYKMNSYDPLLAEFRLQNLKEIGFYTVDFFFNAQVRRTRIFFKIDNATSNFSSNKNYFSAPNYPYRDFTIRFGLVWNWFI